MCRIQEQEAGMSTPTASQRVLQESPPDTPTNPGRMQVSPDAEAVSVQLAHALDVGA